MKRLLGIVVLVIVACTPQPSLGYEVEMSFHPNKAKIKVSIEDSETLILEDVAGRVCAMFESAASGPPILLLFQIEDDSTDTTTLVDIVVEECPSSAEGFENLLPGRMTL